MRIVIFNWRDTRHPRAGGAEAYTEEVAKAWVAAGHEVTMFVSRVGGVPETEILNGVHIVRRGSRLGVYREAERWYRSRPEADLVVDEVNTRPFLCASWGIAAPIVALMHQLADDVWVHEFPPPMGLIGRYVLEPRWLRPYRQVPVLTISNSSAESLRSRRLERVSVVPVGAPSPPADLPAREHRPTVVILSRLAKNKRPDHAVAAFHLVRRRIPEAQLWVIGSGEMGQKLRRVAGDDVVFFGRVDEETKYQLLSRAHCLLATSVREGWGMNVSEAGAVGTRTIGYDVPGLRDSIPAAGGVLTPPTPGDLAQAIVRQLPIWLSEPRRRLPTGTLPWPDVAKTILAEIETVALSGARG